MQGGGERGLRGEGEGEGAAVPRPGTLGKRCSCKSSRGAKSRRFPRVTGGGGLPRQTRRQGEQGPVGGRSDAGAARRALPTEPRGAARRSPAGAPSLPSRRALRPRATGAADSRRGGFPGRAGPRRGPTESGGAGGAAFCPALTRA